MFVIPVVTLVSFAFAHPLSLAFRPIELIAMGAAAAFVGFVIRDGRARRWEGALLIAVYGGLRRLVPVRRGQIGLSGAVNRTEQRPVSRLVGSLGTVETCPNDMEDR